ncbi:MAG: hypothetical protein ING75_12150 [Rhodocyclaceae bacterium]|nr:hypothetical protein [Rhodocyclaceae bacterium]
MIKAHSVRYSVEMDEAHLTLEIRNTAPVELMDLTSSFMGMASEFRHYVDSRKPEASAAELKLYVQEIKSGSIIATLVALSPQIIQTAPTYVPIVLDFAKHVKNGLDFLSGKLKERPEIDNSSIRNLSKFVNPVAKDGGSQIIIGTIDNSVYFNIGSEEAIEAQERAARLLSGDKAAAVKQNVVLYWWQARADVKSKTGDKAVIESIAPYPVKVVCIDNSVKAKMVGEDENPFRHGYIVDVVVETINGKAALYNVVNVSGKVDFPE